MTRFQRSRYSLRLLLCALLALGVGGSSLALNSSKADAALACPPPLPCVNPADTAETTAAFVGMHRAGEAAMISSINTAIAAMFNVYRLWLTSDFFPNYVKPAMQGMTRQLSVVAMHQTAIMGMFLDAKQQLETQRLFQELQAEAHRDYQPSEDFCWFGTAARSMAASETTSRFAADALNAWEMKRVLGNRDQPSGSPDDEDKFNRWEQFVKNYCDPTDNNKTDKQGTGLDYVCPAPGPRPNMDIDYTRAIEDRRTFDAEFKPGEAASDDEQDIIAMGSNLFGHEVFQRFENLENDKTLQQRYLALRAVAAKRNVAQNSYNSIVALKTQGTEGMLPGGGKPPDTAKYLNAILAELGVPVDEIEDMIGKRPSYYAQLEILAKKIYQNPDFFSNLYDTPANVQRKSVALKAIDLMLDRAIFESQLRQEMSTSVLMSARLQGEFDRVQAKLPTSPETGK